MMMMAQIEGSCRRDCRITTDRMSDITRGRPCSSLRLTS